MAKMMDSRPDIFCGRCWLTISRCKGIYIVGVVSVCISILVLLAGIIALGLRTVIHNDIQDILNHLNENNLSDYEVQTSETFWVGIPM